MTTRVGLAVNPTAGRGRGAAHADVADRLLRSGGLDVVRLDGRDGTDLAARVTAARPGLDALVVVGGDGMVHLGTNAVAGTGLPLGVIAAGTGNDVAQAFGLPVHAPAAAVRVVLDALDSGRYRAVDAARMTGAGAQAAGAQAAGDRAVRWFAGVLGAGFDALVNERANRMRWPRGRRRYDVAIALELPVFRPRSYLLELDGRCSTTRAMLVAVANTACYGGGMMVCPQAVPDDGLLDVLVLGPVSRAEFVRIFPRVFRGTHVHHPAVRIERARTVSISSPGIVGYGDGERMLPLPVTVECVPAALRLLAPPPAG